MLQAPVSLLLDPNLTAAAKVLWLATRTQSEPIKRTRLAAVSVLSAATIRKSLALLESNGWTGPTERFPADAGVTIPASLLPEPRLRPQAKLLYGILQTMPTFRDQSGTFTYKALSTHANLSVITIRQLIRQLTESGWIEANQANQLAPIRFTLRIPEADRQAAEVTLAMRRLTESEYRGEALMREYLSLLTALPSDPTLPQ